MFKLNAKKIYTKYDKMCIFEKKIHMKIIIVKKNLELNDLGFLCYSAKVSPDLSGFIKAQFSIFISHFPDITKMEN